MKREKIFLAGASGSMGFEAFKNLWEKRDTYDIVLLQRPSKKNKKLFKKYERKCGIKSITGNGIVEGKGLKIVWGDATNYDDVLEACNGIDWCLCTMAFISPAADHNPNMAKAVNTTAIQYIVKAIESQSNGVKHINLIYIGTVAETGDRLQSIHMGRVGDPLKPSIFDFYAVTKINGERAVLESNIKHWVSLRQTFIMTTDNMLDPIMFHQPIDSFMENNTVRDAGRGLINCLDIPDNSDFWRRVYNMAGGPVCRCKYYDLLNKSMEINGLGSIEAITERNWFALRNFHMQYFEDSHILNEYIHNWGDSMEDYYEMLVKSSPWYLKLIAKLCKKFPKIQKKVQEATYKRMKELASTKNGTLHWYENKNNMRISAFYKDYETYESIPDWGVDMPQMKPEPESLRLDHGYDESKKKIELDDLQRAAEFRGGKCLSIEWDGDIYTTLKWKCAFNHEFEAKPYTVIKAGHWCPKCLPPPWNYDKIAKKNPFFAQIWYPNHDKAENNFYSEDCYMDILD